MEHKKRRNESSKKLSWTSRHSDGILSNVHCQDESSVVSPLISTSCRQKRFDVSWCDTDETETLPSDWLSLYEKHSLNSEIRSISSYKPSCSINNGNSKLSCLNLLDESSQGSDSGLGNDHYKSKFRRQTSFEESHTSMEITSNYSESSQSRSHMSRKSDPPEFDEGFSEEDNKENVFFGIRSSTSNLDFNAFDPNPDLEAFCKDDGSGISKSPFTLFRRNSANIKSPSTSAHIKTRLSGNLDNSESRRKRSSNDLFSDRNDTSTTPKRRKSSGKPIFLKRALSDHPSVNFHMNSSTSISPNLSRRHPTPTKNYLTSKPLIDKSDMCLFRSHSELPEIPLARMDEKKVDRVIEARDNFSLAGNSLFSHILPSSDRHRFELMTVQANDVASLLTKKTSPTSDILLVDCRYPYEYEGGHVIGSVNIHSEDQILEKLFYPALQRTALEENCCLRLGTHGSITSDETTFALTDKKVSSHSPLQCLKNHVDQSRILIFYCEFSSRRAPSLAKFLRGEDRKANLCKYPFLFYPDIYIMSGGYHNFVQKHEHFCDPRGYVKMFDKNHAAELGKYKRKTRKLRINDRFTKNSPMGHAISPLRLVEGDNRPHSSPPSPPRAIVWS